MTNDMNFFDFDVSDTKMSMTKYGCFALLI